MEKDFKGFNHGKGKIVIDKPVKLIFMKPTEIHLKENGSIKDQPSLAIVMERPMTAAAVGEISLEMFNEGLADIGYKIVKTK